ncbi:MAG: hypothetical protein JW952_08690, partial [Candidatus Eisenbacteria bacterium]|nr:hypothetical protein [Candidatus Eisenbacteria bacterium]
MESSSRIRPAKWLHNADSPVMLMVDDFTNVWVDVNGNGRIEAEEDWGHALDSPGSVFEFLTEKLLADCPRARVTFFSPMARAPFASKHKFAAHFGPINEDERTAAFFRKVHSDPRFEVAYHGLTHGVPGTRTEDFVQEWAAYKSLEEALETIRKGKKIYFEVFGEEPAGGKYCGYEGNSFSDESIDRSAFLWWCRRWDRGEARPGDVQRFDVRYFGQHHVLDVPSTVFGAMFNRPWGVAGRLRGRKAIVKSGADELDQLLRHRLVISIQEHISPARPDGRRQTPNIFDDRESLKLIFDYLADKNVWYCTGTELAEYV